ncbi:MAG TPA: TlpA disulfide reductase family protein [Noviherbaspirillum sp.]
MLSVNIGPFAIPMKVFLLIGIALIATGIGYLVGRSKRTGIGNAIADMLLAGIVMARVVFVAQWFDVYRKTPWSILDIRDGGFMLPAGIVSALLVALWHAWRQPAVRKPLAAGVAVGALVWGVALKLLQETERKPMPEVALETLTGTQTRLTALAQGKPLVVSLWATWCPPCRAEMPVFAAAQREERDVAFVFASQGEDASTVERYLTESQLELANVLIDPRRELGREVGSRVFPTTLFYDAGGRLVDVHVGQLSEASLTAKLSRLRAPSQVSQAAQSSNEHKH